MKKRWLTGVILAAVIFVIILIGSTETLAAVIIIFIFGGVWEYNNIVFGKGFFKEKIETRMIPIVSNAVTESQNVVCGDMVLMS